MKVSTTGERHAILDRIKAEYEIMRDILLQILVKAKKSAFADNTGQFLHKC